MERREAAEGRFDATVRKIDHLIYTVPDLDAGRDDIERGLGVRPVVGGRHSAFGTRNALLALGPETYLEVMAPDPELSRPERGRLFGLDDLREPRLATWVLRAELLEATAARARSRGVPLGAVTSGSRDRPDGPRLTWRFTDPYAAPLDGMVPFLIAWGGAPHPAESAPDGGSLLELTVEHPAPDAVRAALLALDAPLAVREASRPALVARIRTDAGEVELR